MENREYIIAGFIGRFSFIFSTFSAASPTLFSVRLYPIVYTRLFIFTASVYSIGGAADRCGKMGGGGRIEVVAVAPSESVPPAVSLPGVGLKKTTLRRCFRIYSLARPSSNFSV